MQCMYASSSRLLVLFTISFVCINKKMMSVKGVVVSSHKMELLLSSSENGKNREMDQESTGSSDDMESPRSVVGNNNNNNNNKMRKWADYNKNNRSNVSMCVHSQILRIREEDSHIGEDNINNGDYNNYYGNNRVVGSVQCHDDDDDDDDDDHKYITSHNRYNDVHDHVDIWIISHRPILPASPLSGKPHIKSQFH